MIGAAVRWARFVWPPLWVVALVLFPVAVFEAIYVWIQSWSPQEAVQILVARDTLLCIAIGLYGAYRVFAFHPLFRGEYRKWLTLTPWSYRQPLPMGPVFPALQDVIALVVLLLAMHGSSPAARGAVGTAFVASYTVCVGLTLFCTKIWLEAYTLAFGLGLTLRLSVWDRDYAAILLGLLSLVALVGLWRSLKKFPWDERVEMIARKFSPTRDPQDFNIGAGWPFDYLNPQRKHTPISTKHGLLVSLLAGWWFYVGQSLGPTYDPRYHEDVRSFYIAICGSLVAARLLLYCALYWPPISFWGRIRTARWIISGYDFVLIAPLAALAALLGGGILARLEVPQEPALAVSLTLVFAITLTMGPTRERWRLTGHHRLASVGLQTKDFERL